MSSASFCMTNKKPIIALDCDGVLLDYHATFAQVYEKTFGKQLTIVSPNAYDAYIAYNVEFTPEERHQFNEVWDAEGWRTMPMIDGALQACNLLHQAGYELVCVTSMPSCFTEHRLENLREHGFPIDQVIGTGCDKQNPSNNPKKQTIETLHPVVFVDDLLQNFKDIQGVQTRLVYIDKEYDDISNEYEKIYYDAKYSSLMSFVKDFLKIDDGKGILWNQRPNILVDSSAH